jgi:hypothetical protein
MLKRTPSLLLVAALLLAGGCGGSSKSQTAGSQSSGGGQTESSGSAALAADARSAATGDIPDNQNFLTFSDMHLGVTMLYPEGWAVKSTATGVTFQEKNNLVRIAVSHGPAPTVAALTTQLAELKRANPAMTTSAPRIVALKSGPAVKATYTTESAPNPVTGKRVTLTVDRYELSHAGRLAILDVGTPVGVDNVDAYKRMAESFKWL